MSAQMAIVCEAIFKHMNSLPSLTALLLVVDALSRVTEKSRTRRRVSMLIHSNLGGRIAKVAEIADWLGQLSAYHDDERRGVDEQNAIFAELFDDFPQNLTAGDLAMSLDTIGWMKVAQIDKDVLIEQPAPIAAEHELEIAFWTLEHLAKNAIGKDKLQMRLRTSVDDLEELKIDSDTDLPPVDTHNLLLLSLKHDAELGGLVAMANDTASTLALPRRPADPDHLPIGGVSDIVNRGHPEQLLVTELAADSDLLMARIVNNQALYLRRESPPKQQAQRRKLLVENSVRTWGMTRIRAAAFALAVAASEERRGTSQLEIYTVAGQSNWLDTFSTRDGLIEHLERLEPDPHPGPAIAKLLATDNQADDDLGDGAEPLLVLSHSTFVDADFQRQIADVAQPILLAIISQDGQLRLIKRSRSGDETLHRQQMAWKENTTLKEVARNTSEPEFVCKQIPPLRFSSDLVAKWSASASASSNEVPVTSHRSAAAKPQTVFWKVSHDRRLLRFDQKNVGATEVMTLPSTRILASETVSSDEVRLVVEDQVKGESKPRHLLIQASVHSDPSINTIEHDSHTDLSKLTYAFDRLGLICVGSTISVFSPDSGRELFNSLDLDTRQLRHVGGAFFAAQAYNLVALGVENGKLKIHPIGRCDQAIGIATRSTNGNPIAIAHDLSSLREFLGDRVKDINTKAVANAAAYPFLKSVGWDGRSVVAEFKDVHGLRDIGCKLYRIFLGTGEVSRIHDRSAYGIHPEASRIVSTRSVRNRFVGIGTNGTSLFLQRNTSLWFQIKQSGNPKRLVLEQCKTATGVLHAVSFAEHSEPQGNSVRFRRNWKLRPAELGACKAWLDSRGMLHLRASDGSELSLVIYDQHISGWASDGTVFGIRYFTNQTKDIAVPNLVVDWLKEYAEECSQ